MYIQLQMLKLYISLCLALIFNFMLWQFRAYCLVIVSPSPPDIKDISYTCILNVTLQIWQKY